MKHYSELDQFCRYFNIPLDSLLLALANPHYHSFQIPKKGGETRTIHAPDQTLKKIQRSIAKKFNKKYLKVLPPAVMGFVKVKDWHKKRDILRNAKVHAKNKYLINLDITRFFPTITTDIMYSAVCQFIDSAKISKEILNTILMRDNRLPQGSPCSPVISNMVFHNSDIKITELCHKHNVKYTRYVDDMSFSAKQKIDNKVIKKIVSIVRKNGFTINTEKTKRYKKNDVKIITGIAIKNNKIMIAPQMLDEITDNISYYHDYKSDYTHSLISQSQYTAQLKRMKRSILGQLQFVKRIDLKAYKTLKSKFEQSLSERNFVNKIYL